MSSILALEPMLSMEATSWKNVLQSKFNASVHIPSLNYAHVKSPKAILVLFKGAGTGSLGGRN